jgi:hypothetical protein
MSDDERKPSEQNYALRNGSSEAAERFKLAIAIVRDLHELSPELLAEIEAITLKLEAKQ